MRKVSGFLLMMLLASSALLAQDNAADDASIQQDPSEEIWGGKTNNATNNGFDAKRPPPIKTNTGTPVDTPIDGGVLILIGAGALYGRKRLRQTKKPFIKTEQ